MCSHWATHVTLITVQRLYNIHFRTLTVQPFSHLVGCGDVTPTYATLITVTLNGTSFETWKLGSKLVVVTRHTDDVCSHTLSRGDVFLFVYL